MSQGILRVCKKQKKLSEDTQGILQQELNDSPPEKNDLPEGERLDIDLHYQYSSDDIWLAIRAELYSKDYHLSEDSNLLVHRYPEGEVNYLIAVLPPVDVISLQSTPIDYFLNKNNREDSVLPRHLSKLLANLNELKNTDNSSRLTRIKNILGDSIGADSEDIYPTLLAHLEENDFDSEQLKKVIAELLKSSQDVFDEVMSSLLSMPKSAAAKILFAYNINTRGLEDRIVDGHWVLCEIQVHKINNDYKINVTAHNPYGKGHIKDSEYLQQSIEKRIKDFHPAQEITIQFEFYSSPFKRRQNDGVSCGVIVVAEVIKRIEGTPLDAEFYDIGCQRVRERQYKAMSIYSNDHKIRSNLTHLLQQTSTVSISEEEVAYDKAMLFLGIDREQLEGITNFKEKKQYVRYKYLLSELLYSASCKAYGYDEDLLLGRLDAMYHQVDDALTHFNTDDSLSIGLRDLELRSVYDKANPRASMVVTGSKKAGVEPGFEANLVEDLVFFLEREYSDRKERLDYFYSQYGDLSALCQQHATSLPKYLVKQDYSPTVFGQVAPQKADLKRAKTIKKAYELHPAWGNVCVTAFRVYKTGNPVKINCYAVLEALANDLARASGMNVQDQRLYSATHRAMKGSDQEKNDLKLMLKGRWLTNANTLSPLAGDDRNGVENYRVEPILRKLKVIKFLTNDSIQDLASYFATIVVQGDYDAIGSNGGNKLEVEGKLFGIDFGHAHREENILIDTLLPNFHIPAAQLKKYKNFSIFYDCKRSELMKGFLIYAKLAGPPIDEEVLREYGVDFKKKIDGIKIGGIQKVFNDYIVKFEALAQNEPQYSKHYQAILSEIKKTKKIVDNSIEKLLKKVGDKINLSPRVHDFLDCLEKASLGKHGTTLRSPDRTVLLSHIRVIHEDMLIPWSVKIDGNKHTFSAPYSGDEAMFVANQLKMFFGKRIAYSNRNGKLSFSCANAHLDALIVLLKEDNIKARFHPNDYELSLALNEEKALSKLANDLLNEYRCRLSLVQMEITADYLDYDLTINIENTEETDFSFLKKLFRKHRIKGHEFVIEFKTQEMVSILEKLTQFKERLQSKRSSQEKRAKSSELPKPDAVKTSGFSARKATVIESDFDEEDMEMSIRSDFNLTGIFAAIKKGNLTAVKAFLITNPVNTTIDNEGNTLLHAAINEEQLELVEYLTKFAKADPLVQNGEEVTPLVLALSKRNPEYFRLVLANLNASSYDHKEPPLLLSNKEERAIHSEPNIIIDEFKRRLYERNEKQKQFQNDKGQTNLERFISDLTILIERYSACAPAERDDFISFWNELCSLNKTRSFPLLSSSGLSKLQGYYKEHIEKTTQLRAKIEYVEQVKWALISTETAIQQWALEQVAKIDGSTAEHPIKLQIVQGQVSNQLALLKKQHESLIVKAEEYRQTSFGSSKEKRELWSQEQIKRLKAKWTKFASQSTLQEALPVDIVFNIISSRILLSSSNSLCGDDKIDALLIKKVEAYTSAKSPDIKRYWRSILQGLLVLGASPIQVFEQFSNKNTNYTQESAVTVIYEMTDFVQIILTHLQQRAKYLDGCVIERDCKFQQVLNATDKFAKILHKAVFEPSFLPRLAAFIKDAGDAKSERAQLLRIILQLIYLVLNDDLNQEDVEKEELGPADSLSSVYFVRQQYYSYRMQCEKLLLKCKFYHEHGWREFLELIKAVDELDTDLVKLSHKRTAQTAIALARKEQGNGIKKDEAFIELKLDNEKNKKEKEEAKAQTKIEVEKRKEAEAGKEAEAEARRIAEAGKEAEAEARRIAEAAKEAAEAAKDAAEGQTNQLVEKLTKLIVRDLIRELEPKLLSLSANPDSVAPFLMHLSQQVAEHNEENVEHVRAILDNLLETQTRFAPLRGNSQLTSNETVQGSAAASFFAPAKNRVSTGEQVLAKQETSYNS